MRLFSHRIFLLIVSDRSNGQQITRLIKPGPSKAPVKIPDQITDSVNRCPANRILQALPNAFLDKRI